MPTETFKKLTRSSEDEIRLRGVLLKLFKSCPLPDDELLANLGLFIARPALSRIFLMSELYRKILDVHGVVMEFGTRWGQNLALFHSFRGMWEPYNYNRKIIGFDTFAGLAGDSISAADGRADTVAGGSYGVTERYEEYLERILDCHEKSSPLSHLRKYEIIKGDISQTVREYLALNPQTVVALAYFDLDLYQPTKNCLEAILPHLTKGSILGFDELNVPEYPGETTALKDVLGLNRCRIRRMADLQPGSAYIEIE
jgi:hypothetical protein